LLNLNRKIKMKKINVSICTYLAVLVFILASMGAWATHVINCIQNQEWIFLIAGALAAPIGIVHGIGIWFGAW
jgi:uncharacterized membrane protein